MQNGLTEPPAGLEELFWWYAAILKEHRYREKHPMGHWTYVDEPDVLIAAFREIDTNDATLADMHRPRGPER